MAAPSSTVWGSIVNDRAKLGIYTSISDTNTVSTVKVQVWVATKWNVTDVYNTLYYNHGTNITSATTSKGNVAIKTTVGSGGGWSESNHVLAYEDTYTFNRGTSAVTYKSYARFSTIEVCGADLNVNTTFTIPALSSYTVSYNANGGSGAPSSQTKYYGKTLTLSSTVPTRSGYTFLGWGTSSSATSASYSVGGSYTANASATLYAVWTQSSMIQTIAARYQNTDGSWGEYSTVYSAALSTGATCSWSQAATNEFEPASVSYTVSAEKTTYVDIKRKQYTVSFNANGGIFTPSTITYYYGSDLYLAKRPTRSGYKFLGWGSSASASTTDYTTTTLYNTTIASNKTFYAIWEKCVQDIFLYDNGESCTSEYIEGETTSGIGQHGEIFAYSIIENTLSNGDFAFGKDFIGVELCEGNYMSYYLVDNSGNQLIDNSGNYLYHYEEI